jgi:lipopolysaccharide transport system permease protein
MISYSRDLYRARDLLWAWTARNIRARYQQSLLGWLWAIIQPATQVIIFSVIFTRFVPVNTGDIPYPIFSFVAVVPWALLASSLTEMSQALVANMGLITKIYFPREILPIAAMLARLMDYLVAIGILFILMVFYQIPILQLSWLYLPVILLIQIVLVLGIGFGTAAANVFVRDVQSLLTLGIQVWFYASPIIYPASLVPDSLRPYYYLNPMAGILEAYRDVLIHGQMPGSYLVQSLIVSLVVFLLGYWFFKRVEYQFADIV